MDLSYRSRDDIIKAAEQLPRNKLILYCGETVDMNWSKEEILGLLCDTVARLERAGVIEEPRLYRNFYHGSESKGMP